MTKFEIKEKDGRFELVEVWDREDFLCDTFVTREEAEKAKTQHEKEEQEGDVVCTVVDAMLDSLKEEFPDMSEDELKTRIIEHLS